MRSPTRRSTGPLCCVILAAGASRRLGRPKQLLPYRSKPLLLSVVERAAAQVAGPVIVVLGAEEMRLRAMLRRRAPRAYPVSNRRWRQGMSASLRAGLGAAPAGARAALILLSDQPGVDARALMRLIDAWRARPRRAAAAWYAGRAAVPAILPRRLWRQLRVLSGDRGARAILSELGDIALVEMPEAGFDVDTPEDAAALRSYRAGVAQFTQPDSPLR